MSPDGHYLYFSLMAIYFRTVKAFFILNLWHKDFLFHSVFFFTSSLASSAFSFTASPAFSTLSPAFSTVWSTFLPAFSAGPSFSQEIIAINRQPMKTAIKNFGYIRISQTLKYAKYLDILRLDRISGLRKSVDFCSIVQGAKDAL